MSEGRTPLGVAPASGIIPAAAAGTAGWNRPPHRGLDARVLAKIMHFASITADDCGSSRPRDKMSACKFAAPQQRDDQNATARQGWPSQPKVGPASPRSTPGVGKRFKRAASGGAIMQKGPRGVTHRQTCMDRHSVVAMPPWRRIPPRWSLPLTTTGGNQATLKAL